MIENNCSDGLIVCDCFTEESLKEAMDFFNPNKERKCFDDNETGVAEMTSKSLKKDSRRHSYENDLHKREDLSQLAIKAWCKSSILTHLQWCFFWVS